MQLPDHKTVQNYLNDTVSNVFESMIGIKTLPEEGNQFVTPVPEVTAQVGFTGDINGVVCMTFEEKYAEILTAKMLGIPVAELSGHEEVNDAIGEIANMVAGNFKSKLTETKTPAILSLPSIYRGKQIKIESVADAVKYEFLFSHDHDKFLVDVFLQAAAKS